MGYACLELAPLPVHVAVLASAEGVLHPHPLRSV